MCERRPDDDSDTELVHYLCWQLTDILQVALSSLFTYMSEENPDPKTYGFPFPPWLGPVLG